MYIYSTIILSIDESGSHSFAHSLCKLFDEYVPIKPFQRDQIAFWNEEYLCQKKSLLSIS